MTGRSSRLHDHPGAASRVTAAVPLARSPDPLVLLVRVPSGVPLVAAEQVVDLFLGEFRLRPWLIMPPTAASSSLAEPDEARSCSRNELKPTSSFGDDRDRCETGHGLMLNANHRLASIPGAVIQLRPGGVLSSLTRVDCVRPPS